MAGKSNIEWTGHTWNPVAGCSVLTPGCTNCYAMKMAARLEAMGQPLYAGLTKPSKGGAVWTGVMRQANQETLLMPLRRKKPTTFFVNSMSDLFHENAPDEWIDRVFAVMALCPQHTFQVLTKRAARMRDYFCAPVDFAGVVRSERIADVMLRNHRIESGFKCVSWPLPNVWLGVSTERQQEADERIPLLLQTPAAVRFISAEPLLGPLDLQFYIYAIHNSPEAALDWIIVGGESGPRHREMPEAWAMSLINQCQDAGVPVFMKQMAGKQPIPPQMLVRQFPVAA
jgi:protein gp37